MGIQNRQAIQNLHCYLSIQAVTVAVTVTVSFSVAVTVSVTVKIWLESIGTTTRGPLAVEEGAGAESTEDADTDTLSDVDGLVVSEDGTVAEGVISIFEVEDGTPALASGRGEG